MKKGWVAQDLSLHMCERCVFPEPTYYTEYRKVEEQWVWLTRDCQQVKKVHDQGNNKLVK